VAGVRQFDEQQALERALEVFATKGLRATSMLDLASGTGVQRGSLYHAYGGKEEIFLRAFGSYATDFLDGAAEVLRQPGKRAALEAFFDFCVESITRGEPSRGCFSTRAAVDASVEAPQVEAAVRKLLDDLETVVQQGLTAIDDGTQLALDPAAAARLVVATTRGIAVLERVHYDRAELDGIIRSLISVLLPGGAA
jgi:AcrR family transcriptional regulator